MSDTLAKYELFIGGAWVPSSSGETFEALQPYTGRPWAQIPIACSEDVDRAVRSARAAQPRWRAESARVRARLLRRLGNLIAEHAEHLASVETQMASSYWEKRRTGSITTMISNTGPAGRTRFTGTSYPWTSLRSFTTSCESHLGSSEQSRLGIRPSCC